MRVCLTYSPVNLWVTACLHDQGRATVSLQDTSKKIISFHSFSTLPVTEAVTSRHVLAQSWICNYSCCHKNASKREAYSIGRNSHTQKKDCQYGSNDRTQSFKTRKLCAECGWECLEPCFLLVRKIYSSKEVSMQLLKPFLSL